MIYKKHKNSLLPNHYTSSNEQFLMYTMKCTSLSLSLSLSILDNYVWKYYSRCTNTRKKKFSFWDVLRLQQFYNIFTTNHRWLVIISSSLNLVLRLLF